MVKPEIKFKIKSQQPGVRSRPYLHMKKRPSTLTCALRDRLATFKASSLNLKGSLSRNRQILNVNGAFAMGTCYGKIR